LENFTLDNIFSNLISIIPVWMIILFIWARAIRGRDEFEKQTREEFRSIKDLITDLDKTISLMAKDVDHAVGLSGTISEMNERVSKLKYDIDNFFDRLRTFEKNKGA